MAHKVNGSLDTNVLLRFLLGDVSSQTRAVERLFAKGDRFEVADATLIELIFVLEKVYGMSRDLIQENVHIITRSSQFNSNHKLFELSLPRYVSEPTLSIIDCVLLDYARLNKTTPLYSFDKQLIKKSNGDCLAP